MSEYNKLFDLSNKKIVITGASGILGSELCLALCSLGAHVACLDVNKTSLKKLSDTILNQQARKNVIFLECNVADPTSVDQTISEVIKEFSEIDILFNNAATKTSHLEKFFSPFLEYSLETWQEIMSVNLGGMFLMAQAVGKYMVNQKKGNIIQTASIYSINAPDQRIYEGSQYLGQQINTPAAYTTSKAGVIGLTRHLATLWGSYGIRVNALCPGGVSSGQNDIFNNNYSQRVPLGRMANKTDIIGPMLFLASDASTYLTGQAIFVDGGLSAW